VKSQFWGRPVRWDPRQYAVYADERGRPFAELVARIDVSDPVDVVDLGCGPGELTATLHRRWPHARVLGVDSSLEMVQAAQQHAVEDAVAFVRGDVTTWTPDGTVDVIVANAVLQWVPGHLELLGRFAGWLRPGGVLAVQVPDNFDQPSHTLLRELRASPRWRPVLGAGADRSGAVERPETYLNGLVGLGLAPDVWQTTYLHVLSGEDAVLEWVKGTALRPVLSSLESEPLRAEFVESYARMLRAAYPRRPWGTVFPFRRTFVVARASAR
jgi:trans-aconitate 2-methyltransferase